MTPSTPHSPELLVDQRGPVLWLTINREQRRNAVSHGVLASMAQAIDAAQANRACVGVQANRFGTTLRHA